MGSYPNIFFLYSFPHLSFSLLTPNYNRTKPKQKIKEPLAPRTPTQRNNNKMDKEESKIREAHLKKN